LFLSSLCTNDVMCYFPTMTLMLWLIINYILSCVHHVWWLPWILVFIPLLTLNRIGCVMVSVLATSVVDRGFEPRSDQTKDFNINICCFSAQHVALRSKSKDWSDRIKQDNMSSEWGDMSTHKLLLQRASSKKIQLRVLV
jgi:hypothetical protein